MLPDPIEDARALLVLARLIYRARVSAALHGVIGGEERARELVPVGLRLAEAVEAAESAPVDSDAQKEALAAISRAATELWTTIDDRCEGLRGVVAVALAGVNGEKDRHPAAPTRLSRRR